MKIANIKQFRFRQGVREELEGRMAKYEKCRRCGETDFFHITLRNGSAVWIQCMKCGSALGQALGRAGHLDWQSYPPFDGELESAWEEEKRMQFLDEYQEKREFILQEYNKALESPEWKKLRQKRLRMADNICEACGELKATEVHHLTYEYGPLPPLYCLRAVCKECHDAITEIRRTGTLPKDIPWARI